MTPTVTIRKALGDPALLGNVLAGDSWRRLACSADRRHGRAFE